MNRLTEDLMDAARIQQGKIELKLERAAMADLVAAALEAVEPTLRMKNQRCEVAVAGDVPDLMVDSARMYQVLTNLLFNAARYSPESSVIRVEAKLADKRVCISVTDSGSRHPPLQARLGIRHLLPGEGRRARAGAGAVARAPPGPAAWWLGLRAEPGRR